MGYRTKDEYLRNRNQRDYSEDGHYEKHKKNNPGGFRDDDYAATDYLSEKQNSPYGETDHGYNNHSYPAQDEALEAQRSWQNRDRSAQGGPGRASANRYSVDRNYSTDRDRFGGHDHDHNDRFARGNDHALNDYRPARSRGQRGSTPREYSAPFEPTIDTPGYFTGSNGQIAERMPSFRDSSNTMDHPHDPDYWAWRNAELSRHDNAYNDWRSS